MLVGRRLSCQFLLPRGTPSLVFYSWLSSWFCCADRTPAPLSSCRPEPVACGPRWPWSEDDEAKGALIMLVHITRLVLLLGACCD